MTNSQPESVSPWEHPEAIAVVAITAPTCEHCRKTFQPRSSSKSGGRPQRFCSPPCRKASNNSKRSQRLTDTGERLTLNSNNNSEQLTKKKKPPTSQAETLQRFTNVSPTPQPEPKKPDFDWGHENDSVIIHEQPTIAVYANVRDQIVIRSQGDGYWTEDQ